MGIKLLNEVFLSAFKAKKKCYFFVQHTGKYFIFTTLKMGQLPDFAFRNLVIWCKIDLIFLSFYY